MPIDQMMVSFLDLGDAPTTHRRTLQVDSLGDVQQLALFTAHELKNPLRAVFIGIQSLVHDLEEGRDVPAGAVLVGRLRELADELGGLSGQVDDLLELFSVGEAGLQIEDVALGEVVDTVLDRYEAELTEVGAVVGVCPRLPVVSADRSLLEMVVSNLVSNAIRYRDQERALTLTVEAPALETLVAPSTLSVGSPAQEAATLAVVDNGRGIDPADHARIFAPLGRLDHSLPGNGLGLPLARRIVARLGGSMGVISERGRGAMFWVGLPPGGGVSH